MTDYTGGAKHVGSGALARIYVLRTLYMRHTLLQGMRCVSDCYNDLVMPISIHTTALPSPQIGLEVLFS